MDRKAARLFALIIVMSSGCSTTTSIHAKTAVHEYGEERKMITQDTAIRNATFFIGFVKMHLGLSDLQIGQLLGKPIEDFNPNVGNTWEYNSSLGTVVISQMTGDVVSYFDSEDLEGITTIISMDDAEKALHHFLATVYDSFDEGRFNLVRKENFEGRYEFEFDQKLLFGEHSIFYNYMVASVRGDIPRVVVFDRSALNFVRTTPPKLDREAAKRILQSLINEGGKIIQLDLFEQPVNEASSAVTVWAASVKYNTGGLESLEMIAINADTGAEVAMDE